MNPDSLPPLLLHGWWALHQIFRRSDALDPDRSRGLDELFAGWGEAGEGGWSGAYRLIGGDDADLLVFHLRPSFDALGEADRTIRNAAPRHRLRPVEEFLSVVELGLYPPTLEVLDEAAAAATLPGTAEWNGLVERRLATEAEKRHARHRLFPVQPPELPWISVYPMERRRTAADNWYRLPIRERAALMTAHGRLGRRYAGRLSQVISGCTGLADPEWVVTLFAADPIVFKEVVTEMRYQESTARFSDFGAFRTGIRLGPGELDELLGSEP